MSNNCRLCSGKHHHTRCEIYYECPICDEKVSCGSECDREYCIGKRISAEHHRQMDIKKARINQSVVLGMLTEGGFTATQGEAIISAVKEILQNEGGMR